MILLSGPTSRCLYPFPETSMGWGVGGGMPDDDGGQDNSFFQVTMIFETQVN